MSGSEKVRRIAMWSGPRNVSTALMRSFGQRADCVVSDEPFYAAYLASTGFDHPMRAEVLASQPVDWRLVVRGLLGPPPAPAAIWYQKHMTHHMVDGFGRDWIDAVDNAFLIRDPAAVIASYALKRPGEFSLDEIGLPAQADLFDRAAQKLGRAPPVVDADDLLADPRGILAALCEALGIPFGEVMLSWPPGRRASDGVWAPAWYDRVEASIGFEPPAKRPSPILPPALERVAERAAPLHAELAAHRLRAG
ncbi:MAG: hypothetical protein KGI57_03925 [Hyphomicrobiales bacterium]|nr:hypothetical protein [Hyphomicrobiales bacterium]MDE2016834.1 hypothetical protein [Hyphomicrobiales bacterium]